MTNSTKTGKQSKKNFRQIGTERMHGKKAYRLRKDLEKEGTRVLKEELQGGTIINAR